MQTLSATRTVVAEPRAVRAAIAGLVATLWGKSARIVIDEGDQRVDAIAAPHGEPADDEADVWLTWQMTPVEGGTFVRLMLDEVEAGPDASPDLDRVLLMLADRLRTAPVDFPEVDA